MKKRVLRKSDSHKNKPAAAPQSFWPDLTKKEAHDKINRHEQKTFFSTMWTSWVSKDAEFYLDFKNLNLP
jgi:hypothetical protein